MGPKSCFICCKEDYRPTKICMKEKETGDYETVDNVQVIFLLRKLLEIPEDTCCKLLQKFGNPAVWVECCQSCLILVEQSQNIFDQISALEKQYKQLQKNIKNRVLKSQKAFDYQSKCETIVRSHIITKDIDSFMETEIDECENSVINVETNCAVVIPPPPKEQYSYNKYQQTETYESKNNSCEQEAEHSFPSPEDQAAFTSDTFEKTTIGTNFQQFSFRGKAETEDTEVYGDANYEEQYYDHNAMEEGETNSESHNLQVEVDPTTSSSTIQFPSCQTCDETFENTIDLQVHERLHDLAKPHECLMCGKILSSATCLRAHMETHSNEKPYKCDFCSTRCRRKHDLKRHLLTHTGKKPHKCEICGKRFTRIDYLKAHMKVHDAK